VSKIVVLIAVAGLLALLSTAGTASAGIPQGVPQHGCITNDASIWNAGIPWGPADGRALAAQARDNTCGSK
jgi:hypothetical protein